ncbi:hypothetical protein ACFQ51_06740 [Streptomyces kaempferi]
MIKKDYRYSRDPANLAHVGLETLLEAFTEILIQCRHMLRPGGHAVITTRPWRDRGELIDLPSAVLAAAESAASSPSNAASPSSPASATASSSPAPRSSR